MKTFIKDGYKRDVIYSKDKQNNERKRVIGFKTFRYIKLGSM
jgi:hypothetical protein